MSEKGKRSETAIASVSINSCAEFCMLLKPGPRP